jgi:MFS family permease
VSTAAPGDAAGKRWGPFAFAPGVGRGNFVALLIASYFSIGLMNQVGTLRAYLFNDMLRIPTDEQGRLVSWLDVIAEIPSFLLSVVMGAASDRVGRRVIYAFGFAVLGLAYFLFPFVSVGPSLAAMMLLAAVGTTCIGAMLAAVIAEYPHERSRGKIVGICFFLNGIGVATLVFTMLRLPDRYTQSGANTFEAGQYSYWTAAALCVVPLIVVAFGLAPHRATAAAAAGPDAASQSEKTSLLGTMRIGISAGRDPRVALAYLSAGVSRASLSIVSGFFSLWMGAAGREQGMTTAPALKAGSIYFATIQATATLWALVVVFFIDRFDRTLALAIGAGLAALSYTTIGLVDNPFQPAMYAAAVFMGIGEMSGVLASQSLIGQVAPERGRGAVIGVFTLCGSIGIAIAAFIGGYLFDVWRYSAPYIVMGCASGMLCIAALYVYRRYSPK